MSATGNSNQEATRSPREHVVQFYDREIELIDAVSAYLVDGLAARETAIVVATRAHRSALTDRLGGAGVDVASAQASGSLAVLGAEETMRRFLVDDWPAPHAFDRVIGGLIRSAAEFGRPIRVYGEMVALLWEAGHVNAAMELEILWNELGGQHPFSLYCAYRTESVTGAQHADKLHELCGLHSAVIGLPAERRFSATNHGPREARRFVVETLTAWGESRLITDAELLVTELAANAVVHAGAEFTVCLAAQPTTVRISVRDASAGQPVARVAGLECSGRGLALVASLASDWGIEPVASGKTVWAELRREV